ncbi:MAG: VapE domain-containing protein [Geothrix sp.]
MTAVLKPLQRVISWSQFKGARDNEPDRHNGTWDELAKLLTTVRTAPKKKDPSEAKKSVPAFSGTAFFEGTTRAAENAEGIHLLTFDFDNTVEVPLPGEFHESGRPKTQKVAIACPARPEDVVDRLKVLGLAAVVYTTWSSSPTLPKFRVVVPIENQVSPAYWTEATEWAMENLGFQVWRDTQAIDIPVLRDTARLNFLPCAPNGEVRTWNLQGKHFNIPTKALPTYPVAERKKPEWQQPRPRVSERTGRDWWTSYKVDFKSLNLEGLVRAVGVEVGRAQPWNGGFKWRCHCPWASEHTHGLDDDCAVIIQTHGDWPAFKCQHSSHALLGLREIVEMAGDPLVETYASPYIHPEGSPKDGDDSDVIPPAEGDADRSDVMARLHRNASRQVMKVPANLAKILRFDPQWGTRLSLNEMSQEICHDQAPRGDAFVDTVQEWIQDNYHLNFGRDEIRAKLLAQATQNPIHPVREHLKNLPEWDGVERLKLVASQILHAEHHVINHQYIIRWAISAVRRVMHPGVKVDTILVLAGNQGFLKSTFFAVMGGEWFNDSPIDLQNKDGFQVLHRGWITELGEIDHLTSVQSQEKVKGFVSSRQDIFRPPYASSATVFLRSCIMVGTTNRDGFLTDATGSRRFWPIKVTQPIEVDRLRSWRDQLWAEAIHLEAAGVDHWLDAGMEELREAQSEDFAAEEPWENLAKQAAESWTRQGKPLSEGMAISDLLDSMDIPKVQQTKGAAMKLATILKKMGWERVMSGERRLRVWRPKA